VSNVLASAAGEHTVTFEILLIPIAHALFSPDTNTIQCLAFNLTGTLVATTCRDKKLRLFDPRAGGEAVRITEAHGGIKGASRPASLLLERLPH
jgi:coronin-1B/1C/6